MRNRGKAIISAPCEYAYGSPIYVPREDKMEVADKCKEWKVEIDIELVEVDRFKANYAMEVRARGNMQLRQWCVNK